ncbi:uncharacterized protein CTRU02_202510 [Colletotrichum truncatum]|uniref:Uncharacterized protein n=1 Tax=Colletotrichum truncatum TaxID=5467 RepID=A0ACC3ZL24_COLTU|nr:uncharacterized protein CTRU02_01679 [Colletotrichum truncatum]KAF6800000.1 hypothetical protein CTRU02_01679 [Colletotrichum truncatum]
MTSCNFCAKLCVELLSDNDVRFHPNLESLRKSAESDCPFCALAYTAIRTTTRRDVVTALLNGERPKDYKEGPFYPSIWLRGQIHPFELGTRLGQLGQSTPTRIWISCGRFPPDVGLSETNSVISSMRTIQLFCFALHQSPVSSLYSDRNFGQDPDPNSYILWSKWCLKTCHDTHKICALQRSRKMPTRVIEVGTKSHRLLPTDDLQEPYVALSYCWGPAMDTFKLTHDTYAEMLDGIAEIKLAKTHQEAIGFSRAIGIKYIWIDALCIIQGDAEDWAAESRLMDQVYGNAAVTIIAGRSSDSRDGFITPKLEQSAPPVALPLSLSRKDALYVGLSRTYATGPVSTRGWCYQEQILSNRSILFSEEQLVFQCRAWTFREDGSSVFSGSPTFLTPGVASMKGDLETKKESTLKLWYEGLHLYTRRKLSNPHDVFAAIASIAGLAQKILRSRYLAGLWEDDIVRGLLWKPRHHLDNSFRRPATRPQPTAFAPPPVVRAPSWSWASVEGPTIHGYKISNSKLFKEEGFVQVRPGLEIGWTADMNCDVSALHMPYCELHILGRVGKAMIMDTAVEHYLPNDRYIQWAGKKKKYGTLLAKAGDTYVDKGKLDEQVVAVGFFDVAEEACKEVWCLLLLEREGLMLVKHGEKWTRTGWFLLENGSWLNGEVETEVKLI